MELESPNAGVFCFLLQLEQRVWVNEAPRRRTVRPALLFESAVNRGDTSIASKVMLNFMRDHASAHRLGKPRSHEYEPGVRDK
nr:hypothetical protein [Leifsonia sp. ZF2019]